MELLDKALKSRERYAHAFRRIYRGLFFFLPMSFQLNRWRFDVVPDFIGYLVIASAARVLLELHPEARRIRALSLALAFISLPTVVDYQLLSVRSGFCHASLTLLMPLTVVAGVLQVVLVWKLCGVVAHLARHAKKMAMAESALMRRKLYPVVVIPLVVGAGVSFLQPTMVLVLVGFLVAWLIALSLIMGLMRQAEALCRAPSGLDSVLPSAELTGGSGDASDNCSVVRSDQPADASDGHGDAVGGP